MHQRESLRSLVFVALVAAALVAALALTSAPATAVDRGKSKSAHSKANGDEKKTIAEVIAASVVSRQIGGVHVDRAFVGQSGATRPFRAVGRTEQRRALSVLRTYVFAPGAFQVPGELLAYLQMQRPDFELYDTTEDPKVHARYLSIHRRLLDHLLHPRVLTRLTDSALYGNEYSVAEYLGELRDAVFSDDMAAGTVEIGRQNLQLEFVRRLIRMVEPGTYPHPNWRAGKSTALRYDAPSQSMALYSLKELQRALRETASFAVGAAAHRDHLLLLIDRALVVK